MKKRVLAVILAVVMVFALTACGGESGGGGTPPISETLRWPSSELAKLLPIPESNTGNVSFESSSSLFIDVSNTTKEQFNAYVDECMSRGFSENFTRFDDFFSAENESGYSLLLGLIDNSIMSITVHAPRSDTPDDSNGNNNNSNGENGNNSSNDNNTNTSDSGWREFLVAYEAWVDSYVEFMKKYSANPTDISLLSDYMEFMQKTVEWAEKADEWEDDLSGDDLIEYLATITRIIGKLSSIID
jgi:hypothetical protein